MPGAPCGRCDERRVGCHAKCERYLTWSTERRAAKEKDRDNRIAERYNHDKRIRVAVYMFKRRQKGKSKRGRR